MFSPNVSVASSTVTSLRNPRRRQRAPSDDTGVSLPRASKRQRSALNAETFVKPGSDENDSQGNHNGHLSNGHAHHGHNLRETTLEIRSTPARESKKAAERGSKGDGSVILTKNEQYVVSKLLALPDRLRNAVHEPLKGELSSSSGYGLALTRTHAIVWYYGSALSSPETFSFTLPYPSKSASDPLPLGILVAASASNAEPGLLVLMPTTGKITYWESITSAAALDLIRQRTQGHEGNIAGLLSGEKAVHIENAEPAGFMVQFSTGRTALLSLRDGQGRPAISVQYLKNPNTASAGLFGSIRGVFGSGAWRRDVSAVRAGLARRGDRDVVIASAKGGLQVWTVHRGGHHSLQAEMDARSEMVTAIKREMEVRDDEFAILDIAFEQEGFRPDETNGAGAGLQLNFLALTSFAGRDSTTYVLVGLSLDGDTLTTTFVRPIRSYTSQSPSSQTSMPRLHLPRPYHTAFVIFGKAVIIASIARPDDSPDSQLLNGTYKDTGSFEDVVQLREGSDVEIVGIGAEDGRDTDAPLVASSERSRRPNSPGCLLLLKSGGVIRITASGPQKDSRTVAPVTVKSKIEQAIHYGADQRSPLQFSSRPEVRFSLNEVERAAQEISREILCSESKAIASVTPSMEQNLKQRSIALRELATYLARNFPPLSRATKWALLWDAEKMAAARAIWKLYDLRLRERSTGREYALLSQAVDMLAEKYKTEARPELGELDRLRNWFVRDVDKIELIVPWAYQAVAEIYKAGSKDHKVIAGVISEADDISLGALETAFTFRQDSAELYGLQEEALRDGLLESGHEGLPEFWTSTREIVSTTKRLIDLSRGIARKYWDEAEADESIDTHPDPRIIRKIGDESNREVQVWCQVYRERSRWCLAQTDNHELQSEGAELQRQQASIQHDLICGLVQINKVDEAIALAEKYRDMTSLVELVTGEIKFLSKQATAFRRVASNEEAEEAEARIVSMRKHVERYFKLFGDSWAKALFSAQIADRDFQALLNENAHWQDFLTRFLRSEPAYAKVSWINDVVGESDYKTAGASLLGFAKRKETDLWSKKIELCIGKLARLADQEDEDTAAAEIDRLEWVDSELDIIGIQYQLYDHIWESIKEAIDESAEIDLAMQEYGSRVTKDKPALHSVLLEGITALMGREYLGATRLIDVLTLIDHHYHLDSPSLDPQADLAGHEHFLALKVLSLGAEELGDGRAGREEVEMLERIIWRRCMIRDDWTVINDTQLKDDRQVEQSTGDTALFRTLRAGFRAGLWDDPPSSPPSLSPAYLFRPLSPQACLGAGSTPHALARRFPEDLRAAIAADMAREDALLERYMEQGRLESWFAGIVEGARRSVEEERVLEAGELVLVEEEAEGEVEKADEWMMAGGLGDGDGEGENVEEDGKVWGNGAGHGGGERSEEVDREGDVPMEGER